MSYTVSEVHEWHKTKGHKGFLRNFAKTTTLHSRHTTQAEARKVRASLNSGHKQQRYWALDEKGRII